MAVAGLGPEAPVYICSVEEFDYVVVGAGSAGCVIARPTSTAPAPAPWAQPPIP